MNRSRIRAVAGLAALSVTWIVACERLHDKAPWALAAFLIGPWLAFVVAFRGAWKPGVKATAHMAAALLAIDLAIDLFHPYAPLVLFPVWEALRVAVVFAGSRIAAAVERPRALQALSVLALALAAILGVTLVVLAVDGSRDETEPADAALLLGFALDEQGRPRPSLVARVDRAAALVNAGVVPFVVVSGGAAKAGRTEAGVMRELLRARGVPGDRIVMDEDARTTIENFACGAPLLRARGAGKVLLVTEPWHMTRASLLARRHAPDLAFLHAPATSPTWRDPRSAAYWLVRETAGYLQEIFAPRGPRPAPCR